MCASPFSFADREPVGPYRVTVAAAAHAASALQRSQRARADPARHRLFVGVRIRRADRCAAHAARLAARRSEPALDHCLCRGVSRLSRRLSRKIAACRQKRGETFKPARRNRLIFEQLRCTASQMRNQAPSHKLMEHWPGGGFVTVVVVSNRVARAKPDEPLAGGLAAALLPMVRDSGAIWVGSSGQSSDAQRGIRSRASSRSAPARSPPSTCRRNITAAITRASPIRRCGRRCIRGPISFMSPPTTTPRIARSTRSWRARWFASTRPRRCSGSRTITS